MSNSKRAVKEWVGRTPETPIPDRVKLRIVERQGYRCPDCTRLFGAGVRPEFDHRPALINGGENRENMIIAVCSDCHKAKTRADVAEKAKVARIREKHLGIKSHKSRPMPGSRASGIRKRMDGTVERW